ncbi:MAG: hypothetical protein LBG90_07245 [Spirochaetaceae bacterium]|jgi:hypothetical protein|nr:hypothetical protein [Spirochaetaceae bacterium]
MYSRTLFVGCILLAITQFASAQELIINYRYNTTGPDSSNYLSFRSPIRYVGVEKDSVDSVSGASKFKSTTLFSPIQTDMLGKATFPAGVRGLLLFPVASDATRIEDNLHASKASNGVITIEYVHRGVAYKISTDKNGNIGFPRGGFLMRTIGYIEGHNPQVISKEFAPEGDADSVDWKKVWDPHIPSGREIAPGVSAKTSGIQNDYGDLTALFNWDGTLHVGYDESVLTIAGSLKAVKR